MLGGLDVQGHQRQTMTSESFDIQGFDVLICEVRQSHQRHITTAEMLDGLDAQGQAIITKLYTTFRTA